MEQNVEQKRGAMRFLLPILGAAIPVVMLIRRATGGGKGISKEQMLLNDSNLDIQGAMSEALRFFPGTPVEVELDESHGMPVWQVEIVPKKGGPTREVIIDARTGDVLEMRAEFEEEIEQAA